VVNCDAVTSRFEAAAVCDMRSVCAVMLMATSSAVAQDAPRYSLQLADDGASGGVRLCLAQPHETVVFAADSDNAMKFVSAITRTSGRSVAQGSNTWSAADWQAGECLAYRVDLDAIGAAHDTDVGFRLGDDRVAAPQLLFLRPDVQGDATAAATVTLPAQWGVSAPWEETAHDGKSIHFRIPNTPANWSANVAFGHFKEERMPLPGGVLRVSVLHGADDEQRAKLHDWLSRVTKAILSAYGRLPLPDVQVLVLPMPSHRRAVMFGQSIRGEGNALELLVDPSRPISEFDNDWVAVHELSHLMHPYLGDRGSWLSEGLATYYQNVLRARAGLLAPVQAWDRMKEGFEDQRGSYSASLQESARDMHATHDFQRIYWSGAAFWMTVDTDLRRDSHGKLTLDLALSRFRDCCLPAYKRWEPDDFVAKLDALLGTHTISVRYREFADMRRFPDWKKVYAALGIGNADGHLHLDNDAPDAALRDAIMAPRAESK
jgi:M61 glycyl aminopeptidase